MIGSFLLQLPIALAFQPNSELRPLFDYHLIKLDQSGLRKKLLSKWGLSESAGGSSSSGEEGGEEASVLGYDNILFLFMVLGFGIAAAAVLAAAERARRRFGGGGGGRGNAMYSS